MLEVDNVYSGYGRAEILHGVSLTANAGEIVALLGLNGAGKSTLLRTISGLLPTKGGRVLYDGADISKMSVEQIVWKGVAHVPEGRQLFGPLTVLQNLEMGSYAKGKRQVQRSDREMMDYLFELFPILAERRNQPANRMSGGEQQMLALARAMMAQPRLLMLDEPSVGLAPLVIDRIFSVIRQLKESGLCILLVEQDVPLALKVADRVYYLETGSIIDTPDGNMLVADGKARVV